MNFRLSTAAKGLMIAAVSAASLFGAATTASAQHRGYYERGDYCDNSGRRAAGTVFGGVAGAAIGSGVAGRGDRTEGAVIGGVLGALAGNAVSRGNDRCDSRGYRDGYAYRDNGYRNDGYRYDSREERRAERRYQRQERRYYNDQARYGRGYYDNY